MRKNNFNSFYYHNCLDWGLLCQGLSKVVIEKYLDAVRSNNYDRAYSFISKTDTTIIDWLELIKYIKKITPPKLTKVIDLAHRAVRQEIVSTSVGGNTSYSENPLSSPGYGRSPEGYLES